MSSRRWIEAGGGDRVLVLLHGVSGRAEVWRPLLPALAASGRRVLAWEMPGYADPSEPPCTDFDGWRAALAEALDEAGVARCALLGHSLGGMIALDFAAALPQRVEALLLACTTPSFGASSGAAQQAFLRHRLGPLEEGGTMAALAEALIPSMAAEAAPHEMLAVHRRLMAAIPADSYRAAIRALVHFDRRAALPGIECPALCIAGEQDRIATPAVMQAMARRLPRAEFEPLPAAGHLAPFERPTAFLARLLTFLDSLDAA